MPGWGTLEAPRRERSRFGKIDGNSVRFFQSEPMPKLVHGETENGTLKGPGNRLPPGVQPAGLLRNSSLPTIAWRLSWDMKTKALPAGVLAGAVALVGGTASYAQDRAFTALQLAEIGNAHVSEAASGRVEMDSHEALQGAVEQPALQRVRVRSVEMNLERAGFGDFRDHPVWVIRMWADRPDRPGLVDGGEMVLLADDGSVIRSNLRLGRAL
jgi:hypothetical protein